MVHASSHTDDTLFIKFAKGASLLGAAVGLLLVFLLAVGVSLDVLLPGIYVMVGAAIGMFIGRGINRFVLSD